MFHNFFLYKQDEPLYNRENLEKLKQYLLTGKLPDDLDDRQRKRFVDRFKKGYYVKDNKIFYKDLELVPEEEKTEKLQGLYDDANIGLGLGIISFYRVVINKYIGVNREDVEKFLKNQTVYQLTLEPHKGVNKPIITSYPNERWAIDLVDMNSYKDHNGGYRYILTCIDYFSKYVWAEGLKTNTAESVSQAMEKIATRANTYPKILQSDNGSEFKGVFEDWAKENKIDHIKTLSYNPKSNGLIENFNKHLRKLIREGTIRYNSLDWIHHLQEYINNRNNHDNTTTKFTPNELWTEGRQKIKNSKIVHPESDESKRIQAAEKIKDKAISELQRTKSEKFVVGEKVRVLVSSLYSKVRAMIKSRYSKLISVKYSPEIYLIKKVIKPRGEHSEFMKEKYMLIDSNGDDVLSEYKINDPNAKRDVKTFFGSELQRVGENTDNTRAKELNNNDAYLINTVQTHEFIKSQKQKEKEKQKNNPEPITPDDNPQQKKSKPKQDEIIEPRQSTRVRTKNKLLFNEDYIN